MKKFRVAPQTAKRTKAIIAAAMALTMAVPTTAYFSAKSTKAEAEEAVPVAVTTVDFEKGFVGEKALHELSVVKSEEVLKFKEYWTEKDEFYYKDGRKVYDMTENPVVQSDEYKYGVQGNQPTTAYVSGMGVVLMLDDTVGIPEFTKVEDSKENQAVNVKYPIGTVLQYETIAESQVQMKNPFAGKDLKNGASISYWVKTAEVDEKGVNSSLIVFGIKDEDNKKAQSGKSGSEAAAAKAAEKEAESKLSIQISTNNDFHYVTDNGQFAYTGDGVVTANPKEFSYVTITITDDKIVTYVNGQETKSETITTPGILASLADSNTGVFFGGNYSAAAEKVDQNYGTAHGVYLDDVAFYTSAVSADEATAIYNAAHAKKTTIPAAVAIEEFDFENGLTGTNGTTIGGATTNQGANAPTVVDDPEKGKVLEIKDSSTAKTSAALLSNNPFAGKDLEGATVNFWVKEPANKKGVVYPSVAVSFADTAKAKNHEKISEAYYGTSSSTVLYVKTDMDGLYCEGISNKVYESLKNGFRFSTIKNLHTDETTNDPFFDADAVAKQKEYADRLASMTSWHMVTAVFTNAGIQMYFDGAPLSNNKEDYGEPTYYDPRFFDGYYQSVYDGYSAFHLSSNNQGALPVMNFLTDSTTSAYFGFAYRASYDNQFEKTYTAYYDDIAYYGSALTAQQVKDKFDGVEPVPSSPPVTEDPATEEPSNTQTPDNGGLGIDNLKKDDNGNSYAAGPGVSILVPAGVLPDGVALTLGTLGTDTNTAVYDAFKGVINKSGEFEAVDMVVYTIKADDASVTPKGKFQLTLAIPDGYDAKAVVVMGEDGTIYSGTVSEDGKTITIETDKLGNYAVVLKNMSTDDGSVIAGKASKTGKTGDMANVVIPVAALVAAGAAFAVAAKKKKAEEE